MKKGVVEAGSLVHASEILHSHGLVVLALEPESAAGHLQSYLRFLNRVSRKDVALFSRQFATLINAGVPIVRALEILADQVSNKALRNVVNEMIEDIEGGKSLSESAARFPHVFSNLYINLVRAGEISGTLDQALSYLADQQERDYDLASKIRGALTYPIFIVSAIIVVGFLMFIFVLPQMIGVLEEANVELPLTTRILIFVTDTLQKYWVIFLLGILAAISGFYIYIRTSGGRLVWDTFKLRAPIFGKLFQRIYMDRLSRNLSTLIAGGIPIVQALHTVAAIVGNTVIKQIIMDAASEVETGKTIASAFAENKEIPAIVTQMIKVGEQTGALDDILGKLVRFYDKEVETMLGTLTTLLEPIVMILLGVAVAVMVAGILLPIYNLASVQ